MADEISRLQGSLRALAQQVNMLRKLNTAQVQFATAAKDKLNNHEAALAKLQADLDLQASQTAILRAQVAATTKVQPE